MENENEENYQRRTIPREPKNATYINLGLGILWASLLLFLYCNIGKAFEVIRADIQTNTIHDTVFVKPPTIYHCWICNKELPSEIHDRPVNCCQFEYQIINGELIGKKRQ